MSQPRNTTFMLNRVSQLNSMNKWEKQQGGWESEMRELKKDLKKAQQTSSRRRK